jgi:TonB family protein
MFLFTVVVLPISLPMSTISNVSFLGPLLEKTAFELMLDRGSQPKRTSYREPMFFNNAFLSHEDIRTAKFKFSDLPLGGRLDAAQVSAQDLFGNFKVTPKFSMRNLTEEPGKSSPAAPKGSEAFLIDGPLARREITFRPQAPVAARRISGEQTNFPVELKIKVSKGGQVVEVGLLVSSGYPDVDMAAINYVKAFRFSSAGADGGAVWDKVKLNIRAQ